MRLVDHHYNMSRINLAFFIGGFLLLLTWGWAIWEDYAKPYKQYQRTFYDVYTRQLQLTKQDVMEGKQDELRELNQKLSQTRSRLRRRQTRVDELRQKLKRITNIEIPQADEKAKAVGAKLTPVQYRFEQAQAKAAHDPEFQVPDRLRQRYQALKREKRRADRQLSTLQEQRDELKAKIDEERSEIEELRRNRRELTRDRNAIQDTIQRVSDRPLNRFFDLPLINFINPRVKIQQFQVGGMFLDYNFDLVPRRDFCMSCHMGIDKPAFALDGEGNFEDDNTRRAFEQAFSDPQRRDRMKTVFQQHPRPDLIGPTEAKYPFSKYGCTGCHLGDGRALSFTRAAHTPDNEEERERWEHLYGWESREFWEEPMLQTQHQSAAFAQFYPAGTHVDIPKAPELNAGRDLWRKYGCNGCHAVEGMNDQRKIGFSLEHVASKVRPDWIRRWVEKPTDFDTSTRMPMVFHKSNMNSAGDRARSTVVIDAIATYLNERSKPINLEDPPPTRGNGEQGEQLVKELGCFGCHTMRDEGITQAEGTAPDLSHVGSKVNRTWLYNWLKDPAEIWPETHMPSMRLSDRQANDITEYLLTKTVDGWSPDEFPTQLKGDTPVETLVDRRLESLAMMFLGRTRGPRAARARLDEIRRGGGDTEAARQKALKMYLGEQAVDYWGCTSCHAVPGHEGPNRIGPELTGEANKSLHKFNFNFAHIPHTRQDFIGNKLRQPGLYDLGLAKGYLEKLRMPKLNLTREERDRLTTHVMSLKEKKMVDEDFRFQPSSAQEIAYEGRKLVEAYNCQGCHTLDEEPPIADYWVQYFQRQIEAGESFRLGNNTNPSARQLAQANMPPSLTNVGRRLKEDWLFSFLKDPQGPHDREKMRTWQTIVMPDFQLTDEQASTLVQGLVAEGWNGQPPRQPRIPTVSPRGDPGGGSDLRSGLRELPRCRGQPALQGAPDDPEPGLRRW